MKKARVTHYALMSQNIDERLFAVLHEVPANDTDLNALIALTAVCHIVSINPISRRVWPSARSLRPIDQSQTRRVPYSARSDAKLESVSTTKGPTKKESADYGQKIE